MPPLSDPRLGQVRVALEAAERGRFDAAANAGLADHPLYGWIELADLRRDIDTLPPSRALAFLQRYRGQAVAAAFRESWLVSRARTEDWSGYLAAWEPGIEDTALRCHALNAQQVLGRVEGDWSAEAQAIWRNSGTSLPSACDPVFAALERRGGLAPALRWERFDKAVAEWQPGVMRSIAQGLPETERALAIDYAAFLDAVHPRALDWPKTERSRLVASHGLAKLGKDDPDRAESLLAPHAQALGFTEADRGRAMYQIALWTVASYLPDSARRLNLVPEASYDARLHEWRARDAMARSDWPAALAAIRRMGADQRSDSRWQYFEARLAAMTGDNATADRLYRAAARQPEFHGFLAADRLDQPYALCPWQVQAAPAERAVVVGDPAIVRAMSLQRIERHGPAVAEWREAMSRMDDAQRRIAVEYAQANGWYDRAVFALGRGQPEELRLYHLRFPLDHAATIRRESAKYRIDPAWVAAEIRAESIFNPRARSPADAMGLMQVLPSTGAAVARRYGILYGGTSSLYDADTNIALGTAYLRQMMDEYGGQPYWAIAGYNAGPAPLNRWKSQRPGMDPDFWIETISYKETREYVARVLAFSVIYDWRLGGDALRLSDRMRGRVDGPRKGFACPAPVAAATGG
ncbi:lytic transglycosylase domain-containing protein [Lysobacter sp. A3-1-A15]|uniref:lytic transglycosylase domain-containing protein n=1 Tax=Novilysobacter viscosus TaxID=3098602 RepID=UPI002EDB18FE